MGLRQLEPLRIGAFTIDTPVILAPMAGVSESPYRIISMEMGAGLAPTELVSAKGLRYSTERTETYLRYDEKREQPFAVQIFGGDPAAMAEAAEGVVARGAKIVDVNMGCPVKKVTRTGAGSALMCDPERAAKIISSIRARVGDHIPVMAKIRAGWDDGSVNAPELSKRLEDAGAAAIAIHGRTRAQGYAGKADWTLIGKAVDAVDIPVIANGDIFSPDDADRVVDVSGCAGVMIGRGALGNPWIFRQMRAHHRGDAPPPPPTPAERHDMVSRHFAAHLEHHGGALYAVRKFRQHLIWYSRGLFGGDKFRSEVVRLDENDAVHECIAGFFSTAEEVNPGEPPVYDERRAYG